MGFRAGRGCEDQTFTLKQIEENAREKKRRVYVCLIELEKVYDRVNREALCQVLRMYGAGGKLLSENKSIYADNLACVKINGVVVSSLG